MQAMPYSQWKSTAHTLHMALQMLGKTKLAKMPPQPEWNHSLLYMTDTGYTTGLIPGGQSCFSVSINVVAGEITARCTTGRASSFRLQTPTSVAEIYAAYTEALQNIGHPTAVTTTPQECPNTTPFPQQREKYAWDADAARNYFDCCALAYSGILSFAAPFRCKKILPCLFWGTFDTTAILFSGEEAPFPGEGKIEKAAFDEKLVEFGFWPGDDSIDDPSFFSLAYPFLTEVPEDTTLRPEGAAFSQAKKEFLLPLKDLLNTQDPAASLQDFCADTFHIAAAKNNWQRTGWFTKPLET